MKLFWQRMKNKKPVGGVTQSDRLDGSALPEERQSGQDLIWLRRIITHHIRMPMSVITGFGELFRQGLVTEAEKESLIQEICENVTYMDQMLKMVFEEEEELDIQRVDIAALAYRMENYVSGIARKSEVSIRTQAGKNLFILADPISMMRLFYHLYENAFKYVRQGDTVQVTIYPVEEEQVLIVFKDSGQGMEETEAARIFEQGFRGSNSKGKKGNGLGMYDVKNIVENCGGTIQVFSGKGKGLSVFMMFPLAKEDGG